MNVSGSVYLECEARAMIDEATYEAIKSFYVTHNKNHHSLVNKNTYIDTKDLFIINNHMVLRIREIDGKDKELTLKVKSDNGDLEYNYPLSNEEEKQLIQELKIPSVEIKRILKEKKIDESKLEIITVLVTERIEIPYDNFLFVIDKNHYGDTTDYNLEVESDTKENAIKYLNELGKPFNVEYKKGYVSKSRRATLK